MAIIFKITSFGDNERIPVKHTCDGEDTSPEIKISGIPQNARSMAIIMDDPDAPGGVYTHWMIWDIDPKIGAIHEGSTPAGANGGSAIEGKNSSDKIGYMGPCPPPGDGPHRYRFKFYVLDDALGLSPHASKEDLVKALESRLIESIEIKGIYERS